jgi:methylated-DNA-[protein]-cysteine S-methyltransferase
MKQPAGTTWTATVDSPIGQLTLTSSDDYITGLYMEDQNHAPTEGDTWVRNDLLFVEAIAQINAYFSGALRKFNLPIKLKGSEFQMHVWDKLRTIPYGETISYGSLARQVGNPKAYRAVGLANGRNPVGIIVPCHRVIGVNGALTGYGGGLDRKRWLLDHERSQLGA